MSDLHAREVEQPDWDGPIVHLIEEERVVGFVYEDGGTAYAEFFPDEDAEPWAFEIEDLHRVLDTAIAILGLEPEEEPAIVAESEHAVDRLAEEFDALAVFRGEEDEGFYPLRAVAGLIGRCDQLDLAVVSLEGVQISAGHVSPVSGYAADLGLAHDGEPWPTFKAGCNVQAAALLEKWAIRPGLAFAVEVGDREGDRYVL